MAKEFFEEHGLEYKIVDLREAPPKKHEFITKYPFPIRDYQDVKKVIL